MFMLVIVEQHAEISRVDVIVNKFFGKASFSTPVGKSYATQEDWEAFDMEEALNYCSVGIYYSSKVFFVSFTFIWMI